MAAMLPEHSNADFCRTFFFFLYIAKMSIKRMFLWLYAAVVSCLACLPDLLHGALHFQVKLDTVKAR